MAVVISEITTTASVSDYAVFNVNGTLTIGAYDTPKFAVITGAVGAGGTGIGAAVDVLVFYNTVAAGIGNSAQIIAGAVDIDADVDRTLNAFAAAGSVGGIAVSGSVVVVSTGKAVTSGDSYTALSNGNDDAINDADRNVDKAISNAVLKDNAKETGTGKTSSAISRANGVGAKTAARVVLELKDKFKGISPVGGVTVAQSASTGHTAPSSGKLGEALEALTVLGYGRTEVTEALRKMDTANLSVEQIITAALKYFAK